MKAVLPFYHFLQNSSNGRTFVFDTENSIPDSSESVAARLEAAGFHVVSNAEARERLSKIFGET